MKRTGSCRYSVHSKQAVGVGRDKRGNLQRGDSMTQKKSRETAGKGDSDLSSSGGGEAAAGRASRSGRRVWGFTFHARGSRAAVWTGVFEVTQGVASLVNKGKIA